MCPITSRLLLRKRSDFSGLWRYLWRAHETCDDAQNTASECLAVWRSRHGAFPTHQLLTFDVSDEAHHDLCAELATATPAMHDALRAAAFKERRKIRDIVLEGIELAIRKRGRKTGNDG